MSEEELTTEAIDAYHSEGNSLWSGDLVNKGSFLTQVKLFTFFDGSELPFEIDGSLNIKTRMPFSKARMILPRPMFDPALPMISKVPPLRYKNLAYLYTEVRGINDVNNNANKTAEFLLMHEWVAVIQTSKETKMYLFPTCSLSHELGITHKNHPQMLHGLFVKFLVNKGTQTPQGYTVEQLYKAGLTKPDVHITRDKVTLYQAISGPQDCAVLKGPDVEENLKNSDVNETSKSTDAVVKIVVADIATSIISNTLLTPATVSSAALPTPVIVPLSTAAGHATTTLLPAATASTSSVTASTSSVTLPLPATTMSTAVPVSNMCSSTAPIVISDTTLASTPTKNVTGRVGDSQPNDESMATPTKCTEQRIGQKRSAADAGGAGTPKRTREMLRSSLQQLLEGRGSVSEDETPRTPTKSSSNIADVKLDNITVTDEVYQRLESAMSMISSRELHSVIKPLPSSSSSSLSTKHQQPSDSSVKQQQQPPETVSGGSVVTLDNDNLTSLTSTGSLSSVAAAAEDKTSTVQASTQSPFNVPTVVYNKPCKKPKSILKGGNKIEQLDDANVVSEDSPTTPASAKVPRKIGLAEYKKRHKERRDSEDVAEDVANNNTAMEVVVESTSKDGKTSVSSTSPTDHLMIIEDTESALDDTVTSKANSDVSLSLKEEKKGDSSSKSEGVISKCHSVSKPVKIPPHPMSVLAPSSSTIIAHKYPSSITDLSMPSMPYFPGSAFRHDWSTSYPIFGGLSRPYLMPHPPTAPLPSNILTAPMLPTIPPPVVYEPLPSVSNEKADAEMARVEGLKEMFTKNLQNKLKDVIRSGGSSRESSLEPRKSRSLSRSQSPPPKSSRRTRSPRRSRRSNSRSQSLDSCRGSDREHIRSRSKSPRSHKSHRSRRHRSSSRDSSVEDRRYFRNLKRRNDKRRDHKTATSSTTASTQTEENTYKSGDTKRLSEKEVQTDKLQFVHSKGLQTYPMFENHKAVQVDSSVASNFYADFAQYLETYPLDMFNFSEILSNSISYFEQEISKAFPCNKTLTSKQLKRILEFNHMKKLRSKLSTLLKESQSLNPFMVDAYRPGTPLLDDNQSGVNLAPSISGEVEGNDQPLYVDESSGLSNSEILSDSDDSNDNVPNLSELLSQYQNNIKPAQKQGEQTVTTSPAETSHTTPTKSKSDEAKPNQLNPGEGNTCSVKGVQKMTGQLDDVNTSKITVKQESSDADKSFVPDNHKLSASPCKTSPRSSDSFKTDDHTYSEAGSSPSGTPFRVAPDPSKSKTDGTLLTVIKRTKTSKGSSERQKKSKQEIPLGDEIHQSIRKGCEEFLSSTVYGPDQCCTGEVGNKVFVESDHDTIDMEISLTDSQNDDDSQSSVSAEEKVNDEAKPQSSKSTQANTEDKNTKGGGSSTNENKGKATSRNGGCTKDLHHYNSYNAVPLHYHAQPFKYRPQRPQLMYHVPRPDAYSSWDWRRGYGAWSSRSRVMVSKTERERQILREHIRIQNLLNSRYRELDRPNW